MKLYPLPTGPIETNAWLLVNEAEKSAVLFDAPPQSYEQIMDSLHSVQCELKALIITHPHWDHMLDTWKFAADGVPVYGHSDGADFMERPEKMSAYAMPGLTWKGAPLSRLVSDGDKVNLAGMNLEIKTTPGHCAGSISIVIGEIDSVVVGDLLFRGSVGRTDLPDGSFSVLVESITGKIYTLPGHYRVCPGHGPDTTVDRERHTNPFIRGED